MTGSAQHTSRSHGPFTEFIGAERSLASGVAGEASRLWAHPTFDTVGSTLGRICERLDTDTSVSPSGVVIIPWAPEAAWWTLVRHMTCVTRFPVGSKHLEENRAGVWVPVSSRRPSLAMSFPLNLGTVLPLDSVVDRGGEAHSTSEGPAP